MFSPGFLPFAALIFIVVVSVDSRPQLEPSSSTTEATTWNKIKKGVEDGWKVVYDESHCVAHKVCTLKMRLQSFSINFPGKRAGESSRSC